MGRRFFGRCNLIMLQSIEELSCHPWPPTTLNSQGRTGEHRPVWHHPTNFSPLAWIPPIFFLVAFQMTVCQTPLICPKSRASTSHGDDLVPCRCSILATATAATASGAAESHEGGSPQIPPELIQTFIRCVSLGPLVPESRSQLAWTVKSPKPV